MKFTYEGQEYSIGFRYSTEIFMLPSGKKEVWRPVTQATIFKYSEGRRISVFFAISVRDSRDVLNKEKARKAALKNVLHIAAPLLCGADGPVKDISSFSRIVSIRESIRAFRTAAWLAYHTREGGLKFPPERRTIYETFPRSVEAFQKALTTAIAAIESIGRPAGEPDADFSDEMLRASIAKHNAKIGWSPDMASMPTVRGGDE